MPNFFEDVFDKGVDVFSLGMLGNGPLSGQPGDPMPDAPDLGFLRDLGGLGFLQDSGAPQRKRSGKAFRKLLGALQTPSEGEDAYLRDLFQGIDEDTRQAVGSLKLDFADRGLGGPDQFSDMEAAGAGEIYGAAGRSKAGARAQFGLSREAALREALGSRYKDLFGAEESQADRLLQKELGLGSLINARDLAYAGGQTDIYGNRVSGRQKREPSAFEDILRNINIGFSA